MKLPWQQPPGLVEGCSSVSGGWLADMLADGASRLLGRGGIEPPPTFLDPASQAPVLLILSITSHQTSQSLGMPHLDHEPQLALPLLEQMGKVRRKLAA